MSRLPPDVPVAPRSVSGPVHPEGAESLRADALQYLRTLSHYRPDYDYCPDRFQYTETQTTDPDYVVPEVDLMSPTRAHGEALARLRHALRILTRAATVHVSMDVDIRGIPGDVFASARHTSALRPDLSVWAGSPTPDLASYRHDRDGVPLLVAEVVSYTYPERRDRDWDHKIFTYARMGIREYWIVDESLQDPLHGFTLDAVDGTPCSLSAYRPIAVTAPGGRDSRVLDALLRWAEADLQHWDVELERWVRVADIPILHAERKARVEGRQAGEIAGELKGELKTWGRILHHFLDATAPGAAERVLQHWTQTPPVAWPSDATLARLAAAPEAWRSLLLEEPALPDDEV